MPTKVRFEIGDVVREIRRQKKWTIAQLAEAAGLNKATISALENRGNYHKETIVLVAKALGLGSEEALFQHAAPAAGADPLRATLLEAYASIDTDEVRLLAVRAVQDIAAVQAERRRLLAELRQSLGELAEAQAELRRFRQASERKKTNPNRRAG